MHRGPSDYRRVPYGPPGGTVPFPDRFNRAQFPPPYRGPLGPPPFSSPLSGPPPPAAHLPPYGGPGPDGFGAAAAANRDPFYEVAPPQQFHPSQPPQGWTGQHTDLQSLEVRKKAEEFLRILEAQDRLELSSEKSVRRGEEEEEEGDAGSGTRSKSRARSKSRHRSRSRGRSRGKSRGRSRARSRSRSRSRGKSRPRAKSRARSGSRSRTLVRSKSQPRLHTRRDSHCSGRGSPPGGAVPDTFQSLKHILQSKEFEKHLSVVKSALLRNQNVDEVRVKQESQPEVGSFQNLPDLQQNLWEPRASSDVGQSALLPHERVGGDVGSFPRILSWDDPSRPPDVKPMFPSIEDEEEFLYGEDEERAKPQAVTVPLAQSRTVQSPVDTLFSLAESPYLCKTVPNQGPGFHQEPQVHTAPSRQPPPPPPDTTGKVTTDECEKVKNLLKTIGLNLGMADISKMAARLKQKQAGQREAPPTAGLAVLRPALETLQALSKAPKSEESPCNRSGSSHSHRDSDRREKRSDEKERREKQIQMKRKEYLVKELEGLLKQEGSGDVIPVIGFFCQRCEEFFGDLSSAEGHAGCLKRNTTQKKTMQDQPKPYKDSTRCGDAHYRGQDRELRDRAVELRDRAPAWDSQRDRGERSPDKKRQKDERSPPSSSAHGLDGKDVALDEKCGESAKSEKKKKKKKEKKMKKEKKKKKKKEKAEKGGDQ
ncbi:uncharacterized protein LOC143481230 [Brachyhypopomus gauderio]|uniref:uncharacterized protein LOC143481230 n=1 Tax=Brachyhypopomus gauderio TaxID=698409 RepID=UPI0040434E24